MNDKMLSSIITIPYNYRLIQSILVHLLYLY
nr:MAG TPA: hypothetical protein [Caudoviricetes sp.]